MVIFNRYVKLPEGTNGSKTHNFRWNFRWESVSWLWIQQGATMVITSATSDQLGHVEYVWLCFDSKNAEYPVYIYIYIFNLYSYIIGILLAMEKRQRYANTGFQPCGFWGCSQHMLETIGWHHHMFCNLDMSQNYIYRYQIISQS